MLYRIQGTARNIVSVTSAIMLYGSCREMFALPKRKRSPWIAANIGLSATVEWWASTVAPGWRSRTFISLCEGDFSSSRYNPASPFLCVATSENVTQWKHSGKDVSRSSRTLTISQNHKRYAVEAQRHKLLEKQLKLMLSNPSAEHVWMEYGMRILAYLAVSVYSQLEISESKSWTLLKPALSQRLATIIQ